MMVPLLTTSIKRLNNKEYEVQAPTLEIKKKNTEIHKDALLQNVKTHTENIKLHSEIFKRRIEMKLTILERFAINHVQVQTHY